MCRLSLRHDSSWRREMINDRYKEIKIFWWFSEWERENMKISLAEINRLLILSDIPFKFDDLSSSRLPRTRPTSVRRWVRSTITLPSGFRISRRTRRAGRTRFATTWAWTNASSKFRVKVVASERATTGLWVRFSDLDFKSCDCY